MSYERAVTRQLGDDDTMTVPWRDDGFTYAMLVDEYLWDKRDVIACELKEEKEMWLTLTFSAGLVAMLLLVCLWVLCA